MKITKEYIHKELFASGDIYWNKKNGEKLLITKAHDVINADLLLKLLDNGHEVICPSAVGDYSEDAIAWFEESASESSLKEKIIFRTKIIDAISFACIDRNEPSFTLDNLAWRMFSLTNARKMQRLLITDIGYFKRSFSIAGAYVLCAFFLGCYDEKFLKKSYTELLTNLLSVMDECPVVKIRISSEIIRKKTTLISSDHEAIKETLSGLLVEEPMLYERVDGSGIEGFSSIELSDLERVLIAVNQYFSLSSSKQKNIFDALTDGSFKIDRKIKNIIVNEINKSKVSMRKTG